MIKSLIKIVLVVGFILVQSGTVNAQFWATKLDLKPKTEIKNNYPFYINNTQNYKGKGLYTWGPVSGASKTSMVLSEPSISVNYYAKIENDTGEKLSKDSIVNVGDKISFSLKPFGNTDIVWNGLGYWWDTPYGRWTDTDRPPNSDERWQSQDYVATIRALGTDHMYTPFMVVKPEYSIHHNGSAQLDCPNSDFDCEVKTSGTIDSNLVIGEATGKFYYQTNHISTGFYPGGPRYTNIPMKIDSKGIGGNVFHGGFVVGSRHLRNWYGTPTFIHTVPQQTINFKLTAQNDSGLTVDPPSISGPTEGFVGERYTFNIQGTYPEIESLTLFDDILELASKFMAAATAYGNDEPQKNLKKPIKFLIDSINPTFTSIDSRTDRTATGFQTYSKTFTDTGINYITAVSEAEDEYSSRSQPSDTHAIEIYPRPEITLTATPDEIVGEGQTTIKWNATNADECSSSDVVTNDNTSGEETQTISNTKTYTVECSRTLNSGESTSVTASVTVDVLNACAITGSIDQGSTISTSESDLCINNARLTNLKAESNGWTWSCNSVSCDASCDGGAPIIDGACGIEIDPIDVDINVGFDMKTAVVSDDDKSCVAEWGVTTNDYANTYCSIVNDSSDTIENILLSDNGEIIGTIDDGLAPRNSYKLVCEYNDGMSPTQSFSTDYERCILNPTFKEF